MQVRIRQPFQARVALRPARVLAALAAMVALPGCEALTLDREPDVAHLEIDSSEVSEVTLVISQFFTQVEDPECAGQQGCPLVVRLIQSDTSEVSMPFTASYPFDFRLQFYAETYPTTSLPATLSMKVHLDDEEWYNDSRRLLPENAEGEPETLRFVYQYHNTRLPGT